ncbi:vacuolar H+/Ca2+ exchanger [Aspergillus sclerotioniger CBS 115572]|uniref:Vacuolar H+/Ca2+ exchanger n=1 Tax=Aspergillus sclerotioniger CBS 115572 TaxID=1450535 RepID=A0A317X3Y5_9EURO|nr:vacuolar H+/Ca2+ exchanger [Aspergillus sclerotioniger CBS 115572]PWY93344.1 vacuolar H+/Ca2+ exchanger [Aspergillus sclerotioniger CBS 115572]
MVPSANLLGFAGGELAKKLPKVLGVLLETTLSSVVEIVLFMVLIHNDKGGNLIPVIQAAILGSILANLLLCLGLCFFCGGIGRADQSFHEAVSEVGSGLLLVAGFGLLIPSAFYSTLKSNASHTHVQMSTEELNQSTLIISRATAIILLVAFLMYLFYNLHSHHSIFDEVLEFDEHQDEDREKEMKRAKLTLIECFIAIGISLACVCMSAVFLVEEIEHIVNEKGVSDNFMGLILVPLVEKAAEHLTAIDEAWDNQINFALFHCLGPSIQTALLNAPLAVLVGWGIGKDMGLNFEIFMIVLVVLSILVVGNFLRDGKSNYLEGGLCVLVYVIIAVSTWYYPQIVPEEQSPRPNRNNRSMDPSSTVICTLKDYEIPFRRDEIQSALSNEADGPKAAKWLTEHLTTDTLLSQEELILYSRLESSGALQGVLANTDTNTSRPLLDDDLRRAIDTLDASTAAIQNQTNILMAQYESLNRCDQSDEDLGLRQDRDIARLQKKHNDLAHALESEMRSVSEQATAEAKRILSSLTARFKEDDKLIAGLERLASGIEITEQDETTAKQASERSAALARYVADEIQCRLDRLYLESLQAGSMETQAEAVPVEDEALVALGKELESLYPEIDILAEVSSRQKFAEPMIGELRDHHGKLRMDSHKKLDYVVDIVTKMTLSTEDLIRSLQDRESFCGTLEAIAAAHRSEVGDYLLGQSDPRRETLRRVSAQPIPNSTSAQKRNTAPRDPHLLATVLRRVGLSLESMLHADDVNEGWKTLQGKRQQLIESLHDHGVAADSPLMADLLPTYQAIRLLSTCLHSDSEFKISLLGLDHQRKLSNLEDDLNRMQRGLTGLDLSVLHRRDRGQNKFVERWGSEALGH